MGANIYYRPVKPIKRIYLGVSAPNSFQEKCRKVFGSFPINLTENNLTQLETLSSLDDAKNYNWGKLIKAIKQYKEIEIWAEY
jgi:hypothetical protein